MILKAKQGARFQRFLIWRNVFPCFFFFQLKLWICFFSFSKSQRRGNFPNRKIHKCSRRSIFWFLLDFEKSFTDSSWKKNFCSPPPPHCCVVSGSIFWFGKKLTAFSLPDPIFLPVLFWPLQMDKSPPWPHPHGAFFQFLIYCAGNKHFKT